MPRFPAAPPSQGWPAGSTPAASDLVKTGIGTAAVSARSPSAQAELAASLPAMITGRPAARTRSASAWASAGAGAAWGRTLTPAAGVARSAGTLMCRMSIGTSSRTGPIGAVRAWRIAIAARSAIRSVAGTDIAHFTAGRAIASWSIPPCIGLVSTSRSGAAPTMNSTGDPSSLALAIAEIALVKPGPAVTMQTPRSPVTRA